MVLALVLINGGLVLALFYLDAYELFGIPVVYVLVPIIFVLENICFISWVIRKGNAEYEDDEEEDEDGEEKEEKIPETPYSSNISGDTRPAKDLEEDLAKAAAMAKRPSLPEYLMTGNTWTLAHLWIWRSVSAEKRPE